MVSTVLALPLAIPVWAAEPAPVAAAPAAAPTTQPTSTDANAAPAQLDARTLTTLATQGKFDQLLALLHAMPGDVSTPPLVRLTADLNRYSTQQAKAAAVKNAEFNKILAKLTLHLEQNDLEAAIVDSIEAHDVAPSPEQFLQGKEVTRVAQQANVLITQSIAHGDWIEALALLRGLDVLFDDRSTFRAQMQQVNRHVRILRLYAPTELQKLITQRRDRLAKRAAATQPAPIAGAPGATTQPAAKTGDKEKDKKNAELAMDKDKETWAEKLDGVDMTILRAALSQASRMHVASKGLLPLMRGAFDSLTVLLDTKGLEATFPRFKDEKAVAELRAFIVETRKGFDKPDLQFNYVDAVAAFDRLFEVNERTLKLSEGALVYELAEGAFDTLDEFSSVIWPRETESFNRNFVGKFFGVGVLISNRDDRIVIISPLQNSPAMKAGIRAGDAIATVDGKDTSDWTIDRAVREITGPEGTQVTLGIERPGQKTVIEFKLNRAEIPIETIKGWQHTSDGGWDYMIDPAARIGYVRLGQFIPQTAEDLDKAIKAMEAKQPLSGLIIDLRFNPGGLLTSAVDVVDRFVSQGVIVSTAGPDPARNSQYTATPGSDHYRFPLVVLVNQGSASASEIVSGALQDHKRALIVGSRSFGKGSVQDVFPIDGGRAFFKVTTQYYKLPNGRIIHRQPDSKTWGIEPDIHIPITTAQLSDSLKARQELDIIRNADEPVPAPTTAPDSAATADEMLSKGLDPQLEAALLVLQARLASRSLSTAAK